MQRCVFELLYADDTALIAHSLTTIQHVIKKCADITDINSFGQFANTKKTGVIHQHLLLLFTEDQNIHQYYFKWSRQVHIPQQHSLN